jgi:biopolymer transport protein ExbD
MGMNAASLSAGNAVAEPMMEMNMTPLIDVMLVLIIMLIITIPKQNHAVNIGMGGSPLTSAPAPVMTIDVDFDGTVSLDGLAVSDQVALASKLKAVANAAVRTEVHIRANKFAPYKFVAGVLATAQRAGVAGIAIVGNDSLI